MIIIDFFIKGLIIGISVAALIGPIAILCIHRTLAQGFKSGFMTGVGAALADSVYGIIAGAGLASLANLLIAHESLIAGTGSLFLFWLGISALRSTPAVSLKGDLRETTLFRSFGSAFFLTLSSPFTILSFTAIFAGMGVIGLEKDYSGALSLVIGVFIGSLCWWLFLSGLVEVLREKLSPKLILGINRASGIVLLGFGCYAFIKAGGLSMFGV